MGTEGYKNRKTYLCSEINHIPYMKRSVLSLLALFFVLEMQATDPDSIPARFEGGIDYTAEVQTDFKGGCNELNLLRLDGQMNLNRSLRLKLATLTVAKTSDAIMGDLQTFSNIEFDKNIALTLAVAGAEWETTIGSAKHTVFAGVWNTGEDYFTSDLTAFFTNSSCGIYPTLSANSPIATYPFAALALHYTCATTHWGVKGTIVNGEGRYRLTGSNHLFRLLPRRDGITALAQGEYRTNGSGYYFGGSIYKSSPTLWTYAEQRVASTPRGDVSLLAAYSQCMDHDADCHSYAALGAKMEINKIEAGIVTQYADFAHQHEWSTELGIRIPLFRCISLQPTLHYIDGSTASGCIGMLRLNLAL